MDKEIVDRIRDFKEGFPNLSNGLSGRSLRLAEERMPLIADYVAKEEIPNAVLGDMRNVLSDLVRNGYAKLVDVHYDHHATPPQPAFLDELYWTVNKDLHTVNSTEKKVEKLKKQFPEMVDHPVSEALKTLFSEAKILSEVGQFLKDHAVKRVIKTDEEREAEAKYVPPMADKASEALVRGVLITIANESYEHIKSSLTSYYVGVFDRALEKSAKDPGNRERSLSPTENRMLAVHARRSSRSEPYTPYPNRVAALDAIGAEAEKEAISIREQFVVKNLRKIASIVDKKGGLNGVDEIERKLDIGGLEGRLRFSFNDGSSFEANNSVVSVVNSHGTFFQRFPLTFHNIVSTNAEAVSELKKGQTLLAKRSEEWMNNTF